jgi:hypothetical protein
MRQRVLQNNPNDSELIHYLIDSEGIISDTPRRDVAVSFSEAVVGENHFYTLQRMGATQEIALALRKLP